MQLTTEGWVLYNGRWKTVGKLLLQSLIGELLKLKTTGHRSHNLKLISVALKKDEAELHECNVK